MSKRLLTATFGIALCVLATNANARPHEFGTAPSEPSYSSDERSEQVRSPAQPSPARDAVLARSEAGQGQRRQHARQGGGGAGASRSCLTPAARALLGRIEAQFGTMQIISTCRPGARIAGSGRISKHASGEAIDFNAPAAARARSCAG